MATVTSRVNGAELAPKKWQRWTGRVLSALPILMMTMSSVMKLAHVESFVGMWTGKLGFPESTLSSIGLLELLCVVVYAVPRTTIGAVLLTAYLGGAVTAHVRVADPFAIPVLLGVLVWAGLYFRDERVRALVPVFRSSASGA